MKAQTINAVFAASLALAGAAARAQQYPEPVNSAPPAHSSPPANSTPDPEARTYPYPTDYLTDSAAMDGPHSPAQPLTYYNAGLIAADGTARAAGPMSDEAAAGCGPGDCGSCLDGCAECCEPYWAHRTGLFAGMLFLRQRGHDVAYAVPRNGIDPTTATAFGPTLTASPNYSIGYFGGYVWALDRCTSIVGTYTYYQSETNGSYFGNPPLSVHSLVADPHTYTAASDSLAALARYNVRFQFADVDYRKLLAGGANYFVNWSIGARYAQLSELFRSSQVLPGTTNVGTNVGFDGAGARAGLLGQRGFRDRGLFFYGNGFASVVTGNVRASYLQTNNFQGTMVVNRWTDFRTLPILEYEIGTGWQSANGRLRISGGYYFAAWFNTLSTSNYIQDVQAQNFVNNWGNSSVTTFDGLTARLQYVW